MVIARNPTKDGAQKRKEPPNGVYHVLAEIHPDYMQPYGHSELETDLEGLLP
jgi:hypothetical protein